MIDKIMRFLRHVAAGVIIGLAPLFAAPYVVGVYYNYCSPRFEEQVWLSRAMYELQYLRSYCTDPELQEVLDYAMTRYNKIGGFDVAFIPLACFDSGYETEGLNCVICPGITLDPRVMSFPIRHGAIILVHESLHDKYYGWNSHDIIYPITDRLEKLGREIDAARSRNGP